MTRFACGHPSANADSPLRGRTSVEDNSGSALVDISGRVIGIPTLAAINPEMGSQARGIGFAIDSNTVRRITGNLLGSQ